MSKDKTTKSYDDLVQLDIKELTKRLGIGVPPFDDLVQLDIKELTKRLWIGVPPVDDLVQLDIKDLTKRPWIRVPPVAGSSLEALHLKASREIRGIAKNVQ